MDRPPEPKDPNRANKPRRLQLRPACGPSNLNPFTLLAVWVSKSLRKPHNSPSGSVIGRPALRGSPVSWRCAAFWEMERGDGEGGGECELFSDTVEEEHRESSSSCEASSKESSVDARSKAEVSDTEMMKERFSKLLLGEDMSGSGKGVCTALAVSNAITNLCATLFGQLWRLEPLPKEKRSMWQREMECILCVSDHIVEMRPSWQTFPDGRRLEVMTCRPRPDLFINLPALRKLDTMLLGILDSFREQEFWYVEQGVSAADPESSASFRMPLQRQEEKWWLPVPRVPPAGLSDGSRKQLQHRRECANQILKAAMAINGDALAEMEVPESYLESLPKNGRESLGEVMHRYITSDQFSSACLLDCLEFSSEHQALEIANRLESSIYVWRQRAASRAKGDAVRSNPRSSWGMVKERMIDAEKRESLADRAESLLICLKQRFPGLTQTTLDMSKIQFNKDVGKSILESYSRVLESLAFNIVARIDDVLYADDLTKHSDDQLSSVHKRAAIPYPVPVSGTISIFSPSPSFSPAGGERLPFIGRKTHGRGFSVKKVLTDYLSGESKGRNINHIVEVSAPILVVNHGALSR